MQEKNHPNSGPFWGIYCIKLRFSAPSRRFRHIHSKFFAHPAASGEGMWCYDTVCWYLVRDRHVSWHEARAGLTLIVFNDSVKLDEPPLEGDGYGVGTACCFEFVHDVLAMIVDGPFRDPQDTGYVPGALALAHPLQHFPLPAGERCCLFLAFVLCGTGKGLAQMRQGVMQNDLGTAAGIRGIFAGEDRPAFCYKEPLAASGMLSSSCVTRTGERIQAIGPAPECPGDIEGRIPCIISCDSGKVHPVVFCGQQLEFLDKPVERVQGITVQALMNDLDQTVGIFFRQIVHSGFTPIKNVRL